MSTEVPRGIAAQIPVYAFRAAALLAAALFALHSLTTLASQVMTELMFDQYRQYLSLLSLPFPENIFALENGHRPVVPNLVRWADAHWFSADQTLVIMLAAVLTAATIGMLLAALMRNAEGSRDVSAAAAGAVAVALAILWLGNARMLIHASETLHVQFILAGLLFACWCLIGAARDRERHRWMIGAGLGAAIATFSFGPGIATFPALILAAVALRLHWRVPVFLAALCATVLASYVLAMPGAEGVRNASAIAPMENLRFATQWLSGPWIVGWLGMSDTLLPQWQVTAMQNRPFGSAMGASAQAIATILPATGGWWSSSAAIGASGLIATCVLAARALWLGVSRRSPALLLGLGLSIFGASIAILIGISRHDYFVSLPGQIFADRYQPWPCVFWLGLWMAGLSSAGPRLRVALLLLPLLTVLLSIPSQSALAGWSEAVNRASIRTALAMRLGAWDPQHAPHPDESDRNTTLSTVQLMREQRLGMFRDSWWLDGTAQVAAHAPAATAAITSRAPDESFVDPLSGRLVMRYAGWLTPGVARSIDSRLLLIDSAGSVRGYGALNPVRRDWLAPFDRETPAIFDAVAFAAEDCTPFRLLAWSAGAPLVLGEFASCDRSVVTPGPEETSGSSPP